MLVIITQVKRPVPPQKEVPTTSLTKKAAVAAVALTAVAALGAAYYHCSTGQGLSFTVPYAGRTVDVCNDPKAVLEQVKTDLAPHVAAVQAKATEAAAEVTVAVAVGLDKAAEAAAQVKTAAAAAVAQVRAAAAAAQVKATAAWTRLKNLVEPAAPHVDQGPPFIRKDETVHLNTTVRRLPRMGLRR